MSDPTQDTGNLDFFGRVVASVSHELNNVNSTIEQILGLLEDHAAAARSGREIDPQRLLDIHERTRRQTRRATDIIGRLNRFAHTADDPDVRFDAGALTADLLALGERLAGRRRVELAALGDGGEVPTRGDPFRLARTIFGVLAGCWERAPSGTSVAAGAELVDGAPRVRIRAPHPEGGAAEDLARNLVAEAAGLGADVTHHMDGDAIEVVLVLAAPER